MKKQAVKLKNQMVKYRRLFYVAIILWLFFYLSGFLTGWWVVKGKLGSFPEVTGKTRLLIIAPHPDDETVMAGGLIQRVLEKGGLVKIIYLTAGDASRFTVAYDSKKIDLDPSDFIALGETRIKEAVNASQILGVKKEDVYFLGFPDQGLTKIFEKNYNESDGNYISPTTKVDHVVYPETFHPSEAYLGKNLVGDTSEVVKNFNPTIVVTGHPRDNHPDHKISYTLIEKIKTELNLNFALFSSLTHFRGYPNPGGYLFPPKKLFGADWVSLELISSEISLNKKAIEAHVSQYEKPEDKIFLDRLTSRNEIFEAE